MADMFDISGKVALITGSSRGLGYAIARGFSLAGAKVALNARHPEMLDQAVVNLRQSGGDAAGFCFDITDAGHVERGVAAVEDHFGPIDILVNNAGIHQRAALADMTPESFREVVDVNLTGAFIVGQCVARRMIARNRGKIINIVSLNSIMARPNIGNYAAAKGGLTMLTKSMATEWGPYHINTNAIGPGYFKTELNRALYEDPAFDAWVKSEVPLGRWGDPAELIGAAIFLASAASDYVNGHCLYVDGGWLASL